MSEIPIELPKWLRGPNQKITIYYQGRKTDKSKTDTIPIKGRKEDRAALVGSPLKVQLMQERLDLERVGNA